MLTLKRQKKEIQTVGAAIVSCCGAPESDCFEFYDYLLMVALVKICMR